jgi:YVTN family beta-propeller protein
MAGSLVPYVADTLVLLNDTVLPGNALPPDGLSPGALVYDPAKGEVFVLESNSGSVSVLDDATDRVVATIPVGNSPMGGAYDAGKGEVFVTDAGSGNVSVINDTTDSVVATVPVGQEIPDGVAYDAAQGEIFVATTYADKLTVISDATDRIVTTIRVGSHPAGIVYDSGRGEVVVANSGSANVSLVDAATDKVVATVPTGSSPQDVAYDSGRGELFVSNAGSDNLTIVDDTTDAVVASVGVGAEPYGVAYDPPLGEVFVANSGTDNVSVVNDTHHTVVATVPAGVGDLGAAYDAGRHEVFVSESYENTVIAVEDASDEVAATVLVGYAPFELARDDASDDLFVTDSESGTVSVVNDGTNRTLATIPVGAGPQGITYDPGRNELFVTDYDLAEYTDVLTAIDADTYQVEANVPVGFDPYAVAYDPARGELFVTNTGSDNVSVVSDGTDRAVATISVGSDPYGVAYDPRQGEVFVTNAGSDNVSVINDTNDAVVASVPVGGLPDDVVYDAREGEVFVANSGTDNVTVVNASTDRVVANVSVGLAPEGLGEAGPWGEVLVSNAFSDSVSVINDSSHELVATLAVGGNPYGLLYDPATAEVDVCNVGQGTLSRIAPRPAPTYAVSFRETGLPTGTNWSVRLNGTLQSSPSANISFLEPNGTFPYTIPSAGGYLPTPSSGSIGVDGAGRTVAVTFAPPPPLLLEIWASPPAICVDGSSACPAATGETLVTMAAYAPSGGASFVAQGGAQPMFEFVPYGNITILPGQSIGANCTTPPAIPFDCPNATVRTIGGVAVLEWNWSGSPSDNAMHGGDHWTSSFLVESDGSSPMPAPVDACDTLTCRAGGSGPVNGLVTSATYHDVPNATAQPVSFPLASVEVESTWANYPVRVDETGLPNGTAWSVTVNGTRENGTGPSLTVLERNGTYAYSIGAVEGYSAVGDPASPVTVRGAPVVVEASFTYRFAAKFTHEVEGHGSCQPYEEFVELNGSVVGGLAPYNFTWSFGPGVPEQYGAVVNHTLPQPGTYTVTLRATDARGHGVSVQNLVVAVAPPGCSPVVGSSWAGGWSLTDLVVAALLIVAVAIVVARWRTHRSRYPPEPLGPGGEDEAAGTPRP